MKAGNASLANTILVGPARRGNSLHHFSMQRKFLRDVGCGPDYVSAAAAAGGAIPRGLDFSKNIIGLA